MGCAGLHVLYGTLWLMGHISGHASCACLKTPSFVSYTPETPHACVLEASETLGNSWGADLGSVKHILSLLPGLESLC